MGLPASSLVVVFVLNFCVFSEQLQYSPDSPLTLMANQEGTSSGIDACMMTPTSGTNVRVYAVRTSDNTEFIRHFVKEDDEACLDDSENLVLGRTEDFSSCSEAVAAAKFNSFTYENGVCHAYKGWRPKSASTCYPGPDPAATGLPVYVAETQLSSFEPPATEFSFQIVDGLISSADLELVVKNSCQMTANIHEFVIEVDGTEVVRVPYEGNEMQSYTLAHESLCGLDHDIDITLVDADGNALAPTVTDAFVDSYSETDTRLMASSGDCLIIYDNLSPEVEYANSVEKCDMIGLTLFYEYKPGQFVQYMSDLNGIVDSAVDNDENHYVYLKRSGTTWAWEEEGGLDVPNRSNTTYWYKIVSGDCVKSDESNYFKLGSESCTADFDRVVCLEVLNS